MNPVFEAILKSYVASCPACGYAGGTHAANCPTVLRTPEQRVRRAANLFGACFPERALQQAAKEGLSELEIESGSELARVQSDHRYLIRSIYGDPAYGSYTVDPAHVQQGKDEEQAVLDAHMAKLAAADPGPKPNVFAQLPFDEQLVASIAVARYRKQKEVA